MQECGANLHSRKPAILPLQVNGCRSVGLFLKEGAHREACVRGAGPQMASPTKLTRRTFTPTPAGLRPLEATGSGCRSGATPSCIEPTPGSALTPQGSCARPRGATIARMTVVHVAGLGVAEDCIPCPTASTASTSADLLGFGAPRCVYFASGCARPLGAN